MPRAVISDLAGTIIRDDGVVLAAFADALEEVDSEASPQQRERQLVVAVETMGQSKIEVFRQLFVDERLVDRALRSFETHVLDRVADITALPGVDEVISSWREEGVRVGVTTGFSRELVDALLTHLGWEHLLPYSATPAEAGAGRPDPAMLRQVMALLGISDPTEVIVVGDTASDMEAGKRFGAGRVVGVLSGAHDERTLLAAGADVVVSDVTHVDALLRG